MSDMELGELLESTQPLTEDVELYLDAGLVARRDELLREYKLGLEADKTDGRAGQKPRVLEIADELKELQAKMAARTLVLRVTQMPAEKWAALKRKFPLTGKPESQLRRDQQFGFRTEAVARVALVDYGHRILSDGTAVKLSTDEWKALFEKISGGDTDTLVYAVVSVNQVSGLAHAEQLVKR